MKYFSTFLGSILCSESQFSIIFHLTSHTEWHIATSREKFQTFSQFSLEIEMSNREQSSQFIWNLQFCFSRECQLCLLMWKLFGNFFHDSTIASLSPENWAIYILLPTGGFMSPSARHNKTNDTTRQFHGNSRPKLHRAHSSHFRFARNMKSYHIVMFPTFSTSSSSKEKCNVQRVGKFFSSKSNRCADTSTTTLSDNIEIDIDMRVQRTNFELHSSLVTSLSVMWR